MSLLSKKPSPFLSRALKPSKFKLVSTGLLCLAQIKLRFLSIESVLNSDVVSLSSPFWSSKENQSSGFSLPPTQAYLSVFLISSHILSTYGVNSPLSTYPFSFYNESTNSQTTFLLSLSLSDSARIASYRHGRHTTYSLRVNQASTSSSVTLVLPSRFIIP